MAKAGGEEALRLRKDRDQLIAELGHFDAELNTIVSKDENDLSLNEDNNLHKARIA